MALFTYYTLLQLQKTWKTTEERKKKSGKKETDTTKWVHLLEHQAFLSFVFFFSDKSLLATAPNTSSTCCRGDSSLSLSLPLSLSLSLSQIHVHTYIHTFIHVCIRVCIKYSLSLTLSFSLSLTCIHTCMHICIYTYMHISAHTCFEQKDSYPYPWVLSFLKIENRPTWVSIYLLCVYSKNHNYTLCLIYTCV